MRRVAPLPPRDGLGPARVRLRDGGVVLDELHARFGDLASAKVLAGEVVDADGAVIDASTELPAGANVYLYRELPDEVPHRRRRCDCGANSTCRSCRRLIGWIG